jgi:hypothetical protein
MSKELSGAENTLLREYCIDLREMRVDPDRIVKGALKRTHLFHAPHRTRFSVYSEVTSELNGYLHERKDFYVRLYRPDDGEFAYILVEESVIVTLRDLYLMRNTIRFMSKLWKFDGIFIVERTLKRCGGEEISRECVTYLKYNDKDFRLGHEIHPVHVLDEDEYVGSVDDDWPCLDMPKWYDRLAHRVDVKGTPKALEEVLRKCDRVDAVY